MPRSGSRRPRFGAGAPASALAGELVDLSGAGGEVELAGDVLAERGQRPKAEGLEAHVGGMAARDPQAPDDARTVVAEKVAAGRRRDGPAAIDVDARDRAAPLAMVVHVHRRDELTGSERGIRIARVSLERAPPVIGERRDVVGGAVVDLLPVALADVREIEVAVRAVERESPRVAQSERDHRPPNGLGKRIGAQELAKPLVRILRPVLR